MKRCCIAGTAPSFRMTPWHDPSIEIFGLNDGYALRPRRVDRWYDLHPIDKMIFRKPGEPVFADQIPKGHFVRPEGHVEWLKAQAATVPVFLQAAPPDGWPTNAQRFPIEAIHEAFGDGYWASGPSYMLAQAYLEGYTDIWITGIHLSTEAEYREQRPQFEMLIGRLLGPKVTITVECGFRVYAGAITIRFPEASPVLTHGWKYAYEDKPDPPASPYRDELKQVVKAKNALIQRLVLWPDGEPRDEAYELLRRYDVVEDDCREQLQRQAMAREYPPIYAALGG